MKQPQINTLVDKDGEFEVHLRKEFVATAVCGEGMCFKSKETGELFGSPMVLKGYLHDSEGNLLDFPEVDTLDNYEVISYER